MPSTTLTYRALPTSTWQGRKTFPAKCTPPPSSASLQRRRRQYVVSRHDAAEAIVRPRLSTVRFFMPSSAARLPTRLLLLLACIPAATIARFGRRRTEYAPLEIAQRRTNISNRNYKVVRRRQSGGRYGFTGGFSCQFSAAGLHRRQAAVDFQYRPPSGV